MPIQRKSPPGNQNLATSVLCFKGKGWCSKLMSREQKILNDPCVTISSDHIPEDLVNGVTRGDQIILRLVQSIYSIRLAKFWLKNSKDTNECQKQTFSSVHRGKVSLPFYVHSDAEYETFTVVW